MNQLLDIIFPPRCMLCRCLVARQNEERLCELCRWEDYQNPKPMAEENVRCSLVYEERLQEAIFRMKYGGQKEYARFFARWMAREGGKWAAEQDFTLMCAVPLAKTRMRSRGFNQAEQIARELGRLSRLPYVDLLERQKNTKPQKGLGEEARRCNMEGAFAVRPEAVTKLARQGKMHICLVDDIYTTGSTAQACRQAIEKRFSQARVSVWALAGAMRDGFRQNF